MPDPLSPYPQTGPAAFHVCVCVVHSPGSIALYCGTSKLLQGNKPQKASSEIRIARPLSSHLSHCNCYNVPKDLPTLATWPTPPTRKGMWPTPHPTLQGQHKLPPNQQVYPKTPSFPNQPASVSEDPVLPQPIIRSQVYDKTTPRTPFIFGL